MSHRLLRACVKPQNMSSSTQILVRFVCLFVRFISTLPFIAISNCLSCCLDHCFHLFWSLFESDSIKYNKTLELNCFVQLFISCLFGIHESPSRTLWLMLSHFKFWDWYCGGKGNRENCCPSVHRIPDGVWAHLEEQKSGYLVEEGAPGNYWASNRSDIEVVEVGATSAPGRETANPVSCPLV